MSVVDHHRFLKKYLLRPMVFDHICRLFLGAERIGSNVITDMELRCPSVITHPINTL